MNDKEVSDAELLTFFPEIEKVLSAMDENCKEALKKLAKKHEEERLALAQHHSKVRRTFILRQKKKVLARKNATDIKPKENSDEE